MPLERENIETDSYGKVSTQVMLILADGKGYYASEILEKVQCNKGYLYRVLAALKTFHNVKTKSILNKKTGERTVYFISDTLYKLPEREV